MVVFGQVPHGVVQASLGISNACEDNSNVNMPCWSSHEFLLHTAYTDFVSYGREISIFSDFFKRPFQERKSWPRVTVLLVKYMLSFITDLSHCTRTNQSQCKVTVIAVSCYRALCCAYSNVEFVECWLEQCTYCSQPSTFLWCDWKTTSAKTTIRLIPPFNWNY